MLLGRVAADEAEVLTLAVAPSVRRRGIAAALLRAAKAQVRRLRRQRAVPRGGHRQCCRRPLYRREGFIEVGRRRRYYADASDALVLRMNLS